MLRIPARIYAFPDRRDVSHQLTMRDRLDIHAWGERIAAAGFRCILGQDRNGIAHDFVQLHRPDGEAAWTLVRSGPQVRVWRGASGPDLGAFPTLAEAVRTLLEVTAGTPCPRPRLSPPVRLPVHRTARSCANPGARSRASH